jgi:hypothetical protein
MSPTRMSRSAQPWRPVVGFGLRSIVELIQTRLYPSIPVSYGVRTAVLAYGYAMTLDPLGPTPVYQQLAAILRARIESGELAPNRPIPSETALQQEHGVARGTARRAVALLRDEGLVVTVKGRGTFVQPSEPSRRRR